MSPRPGPLVRGRAGRPWPLLLVMCGVWFAPRRTGRQLAYRGPGSALLVHLVAVLAVFVVFASLALMAVARQELSGSTSLLSNIWTELLAWCRSVIPVAGSSLLAIGVIAVAVALTEVYYWLFGIVVLGAWMGVDLPRRVLLKRSAVLAGYVSMWLPVLALAWGVAAGLKALAFAQPRMQSFGTSLVVWILGALTPGALLGMAFRLAAGMGDATPARRPDQGDPLCEVCGYNLHATGFDRCCPECGRPAAASHSTISRCNGWEVGRVGYAATVARILFSAEKFFSTVRVQGPPQPARRFATISILVSAAAFGVVGAAAGAGQFALIHRQGDLTRRMLVQCVSDVLLLGGLWAVAWPALSMIAASVIASASRRRRDRIGSGGATKIACYLTALAVAWAPLLGLASGGLALLRWAARTGGAGSRDQTYLLTRALLGMALFVWYWIIATRAYRRCRFANT